MSTATPTRKPLPGYYQFGAGAFAGVTEICIFYPLDVVKTRMQLETGKSPSMLTSFKNIIREEGAGRLYRGLVPPLLLEAPKRAVKFASNDFWGKTFVKQSPDGKMTQGLSILTGAAAGATESFVVVPFELVKIRLQDKTSKYAGPMDVVRTILRQHGPLGLYAGMESTFWRHVWWSGQVAHSRCSPRAGGGAQVQLDVPVARVDFARRGSGGAVQGVRAQGTSTGTRRRSAASRGRGCADRCAQHAGTSICVKPRGKHGKRKSMCSKSRGRECEIAVCLDVRERVGSSDVIDGHMCIKESSVKNCEVAE
ncbi:hypothetical protein RSAG8_12151, partial [Rhizoctonia solani AG-8 WAC10335]